MWPSQSPEFTVTHNKQKTHSVTQKFQIAEKDLQSGRTDTDSQGVKLRVYVCNYIMQRALTDEGARDYHERAM